MVEYSQAASRTKWFACVTAALLVLLVVSCRLGLWHFDLRVPITYSGDALYETVLVKGLTEGTWNYYIDRLGAPFGMATVDFPLGCTLDFAIMKVLSFVLHDGCLLINVYWLLSLCLAGGCAAFFLMSLRASAPAAVCCGVLYAVIPFVFYRNIAHLNLVHFIVPLAAYAGLSLSRDDPAATKNEAGHSLRLLAGGGSVSILAICVAIGLTYIYWAFFACIVIAVAAVISFLRYRRIRVVAIAMLYIALITTTATASIAASFIYWWQHGSNAALNYKYAAEADVYGLTIRQMLTPVMEHPLPALEAIRQKILSAGFPNDTTESAASSLGTLGGLGFLVLVATAVGRPVGKTLSDPRLVWLSGLTIALVVVAEVGGFGSVFNTLVLHEFRCYNRISPFISLFSLAAVAILMDSVLREKPLLLRCIAFAVATVAGVIDQTPVAQFKYHNAEADNFYNDREFIQQLERRIMPNTMIFQLPNTGFPADGFHNKMGPYDNARAYLHSQTLRWSWGSMDGRHHDWSKRSAALPTAAFLETIAFAGFDGLLIDRYGYPDTKVEHEILSTIGAANNFDFGGRWVYMDLHGFRENLLGPLTPSERAKRIEIAREPVGVEWLPSFSVEEHDSEHIWRWCGREGVIRFANESKFDRLISITAMLQQHSSGLFPLDIQGDVRSEHFLLGSDPVLYRDRLLIKAHGMAQIRLRFDGPLLNVPHDNRQLAFQVVDFHLEEIDSQIEHWRR